MRGIGIAVINTGLAAGVFLENLGHGFAQEAGADGEIAGGDAFGGGHHVGLDAPVTRAGPIAGAAKAGNDLIRDQEDAVAIADIAHQAHEGGIRHDDAARPLDRFHNEGGDGVGTLKAISSSNAAAIFCASCVRIGLVERVAVGVGRGQVKTAGQERFVIDAKAVVAVYRRAAEMCSVIALFERDILGAGRLAAQAVILPRQTQGGLDAIASAGGKEHPAHAIGGKELAHGEDASMAGGFDVPAKAE